MGDQPTYAELRKQREDEPAGGNFLSAKDFPNGLDATVKGVEIRPDTKYGKGPQAYWQVTAPGVEGTKLLKENGSMSDRLTELGIADPTGKTFLLSTAGEIGKKYWLIARAL
jgi:hypothetical protein